MGQAALLLSSQELWVLTTNYPGLVGRDFPAQASLEELFQWTPECKLGTVTSVNDNWLGRGGEFLGYREKKRTFHLFAAGDRFKVIRPVRKGLCHRVQPEARRTLDGEVPWRITCLPHKGGQGSDSQSPRRSLATERLLLFRARQADGGAWGYLSGFTITKELQLWLRPCLQECGREGSRKTHGIRYSLPCSAHRHIGTQPIHEHTHVHRTHVHMREKRKD
jgi:hypothetical protein